MGICSECKHAVFGAIGNYCAVDKHGIKAEGSCTIGEFVKYEPKTYEPPKSCADQCDKSTCAGCADDDDAYSMPGWWSPSSNLTQLEFIHNAVVNSAHSGDAADHYILVKFAGSLLHLDDVLPARVETAEFSVVDPGGASDTYIRFVSMSLNAVGSSESFSNIKAAQDAKNFIDKLIDLYDGQISVSNSKIGPGVSNVKFNGGKYYTVKTPATQIGYMTDQLQYAKAHVSVEKIIVSLLSSIISLRITKIKKENLILATENQKHYIELTGHCRSFGSSAIIDPIRAINLIYQWIDEYEAQKKANLAAQYGGTPHTTKVPSVSDVSKTIYLNGEQFEPVFSSDVPTTSSTMTLHINGEKVELDFSSDTSAEEIARAMNQNLDDRGVSGVRAIADNEPDMQIISMRHGNWVFYLEMREGATLEEITEVYQKAVMMSNLREYCETDALCEKELVAVHKSSQPDPTALTPWTSVTQGQFDSIQEGELVSCPSGDLEVVNGEICVALAKTSYDDFSDAILKSIAELYGVPSDWVKASFELANQPYLPERYKK